MCPEYLYVYAPWTGLENKFAKFVKFVRELDLQTSRPRCPGARAAVLYWHYCVIPRSANKFHSANNALSHPGYECGNRRGPYSYNGLPPLKSRRPRYYHIKTIRLSGRLERLSPGGALNIFIGADRRPLRARSPRPGPRECPFAYVLEPRKTRLPRQRRNLLPVVSRNGRYVVPYT
ncbi:hypothetical protein EVAR_79457_1 [Eumeta japonica]|uniref:Uncharacterized protein n=1 Tax=Eumeta variegata TaxID=151549 RepID=A0A4C1UDY5_EUMVA|nr:hypothetical protein EVAR_79457_1 [Eumeta japonica]